MPRIKARLCAPVALIAAVAAEAAVSTATPDVTRAPGGSFLAHRTEIAPEAVRRVTLTAGPDQSGLLVQYAEMAGDEDICGDGMKKLRDASSDSTLEVTFKAQAGPANFPGLLGVNYPADTDYVVTVTGPPDYAPPTFEDRRRIGWKNAKLVHRARSTTGFSAGATPEKTSKIFFKIQEVPAVGASEFAAQAATLSAGQYRGLAAIDHALGPKSAAENGPRTPARAAEATRTRDDFLRLVYAPPIAPTPTSFGAPGKHKKKTCELLFSPMAGTSDIERAASGQLLETQDLEKWLHNHAQETDQVQSMYKMFVKHFRVMHRNGLYYTDGHAKNLQVAKLKTQQQSGGPSLRGGKTKTMSMQAPTYSYQPAVVDMKALTYIPKDLPEGVASGKYSLTHPNDAAAQFPSASEAEKQLESEAGRTGINAGPFWTWGAGRSVSGRQASHLALGTFDPPGWLPAVRAPRSGHWFEAHKGDTVHREWLFGAMEETCYVRSAFHALFDRKTKERLEQEVLDEEIRNGVFQDAAEQQTERSLIEWKNQAVNSCCGGSGGGDPDEQPGL